MPNASIKSVVEEITKHTASKTVHLTETFGSQLFKIKKRRKKTQLNLVHVNDCIFIG